MKNSGWTGESQRHALSAKGIKTGSHKQIKIYSPSRGRKNENGWNTKVAEYLNAHGLEPKDCHFTERSRETRCNGTPCGVCQACGQSNCADLFEMRGQHGNDIHMFWVGSSCVETICGVDLTRAERDYMDRVKKESKANAKMESAGITPEKRNEFKQMYHYNSTKNEILVGTSNGYPIYRKLEPKVVEILNMPMNGRESTGKTEGTAYVLRTHQWSNGQGQHIDCYGGINLMYGNPKPLPVDKKIKIKYHKGTNSRGETTYYADSIEVVDETPKSSKSPLTTKQRNSINTKYFAGPNRSFPVEDEGHVRSALGHLNASHYSVAEKKNIKKILRNVKNN